jgi:hypothetical protein
MKPEPTSVEQQKLPAKLCYQLTLKTCKWQMLQLIYPKVSDEMEKKFYHIGNSSQCYMLSFFTNKEAE